MYAKKGSHNHGLWHPTWERISAITLYKSSPNASSEVLCESPQTGGFHLCMYLRINFLKPASSLKKTVSPKWNQFWIFTGKTDAQAEASILWPPDVNSQPIGKDPDAEKDWGQEEKGDRRGWDGWMASPTRRTWVWVSSRSWLWTGKPGVLKSMGSQRVRHDWATELNWTELKWY